MLPIGLNATAGVAALGGMRYALRGSPFEDYRLPGLFLGCVYAPLSLASALAAGAVQGAWIAAQVAVIGLRSFLQPTLGAVAAVDLMLAWRGTRRS